MYYSNVMGKQKHDYPFSFRAPASLAERLDQYAEKLGIDRSAVIKLALGIWLDRMDEINGRIMTDLIKLMNESPQTSQRVAEEEEKYKTDDKKE